MGKGSKSKNGKSKSKFSTCHLCPSPASVSCSSCGIAQVCGEAHLRRHRPEQLCFPFRVDFDATKGRILRASRDIAALELILYDDRPVVGPKFNDQPVCLKCLRPIRETNYELCRRCKWPMCIDKCTNKSGHEEDECSILAVGSDKKALFEASNGFSSLQSSLGYYRSISVLRLLLLRDKHPDWYSEFCTLMDHNDDRRRDSETWKSNQHFVNDFLLRQCELDKLKFDDDDVYRATGIVWTNAFGHSNKKQDGEESGGGQAVFPLFSLISHDCTANCNHVVLPARSLALQAKVAIAKGQELTISYISPIQSTMRRRSKLLEKWFFGCSCARCSTRDENGSHASSILCQSKKENGEKCQGVLTFCHMNTNNELRVSKEDEWKCSHCSSVIPASDILNLENDIVGRLQSVAAGESDVSETHRLVHELATLLHSNHYLMLLLKRHLIVQSSSSLPSLTTEKLQYLKSLCEEVLNVLNIIDPGCSRDRGVALRQLSEVSKFYYKRIFVENRITQHQLAKHVQDCMILLEESQRCMAMLIKKN